MKKIRICILIFLCILVLFFATSCVEKEPEMKTIYVATKTVNNLPSLNCHVTNTVTLSENGFPILTSMEYSDNSVPPTIYTYLYDYNGLSERMVDLAVNCTSMHDDSIESQIKKVQAEFSEFLGKSNSVHTEGSSYKIVGIDSTNQISHIFDVLEESIASSIYHPIYEVFEQMEIKNSYKKTFYFNNQITNTITKSYDDDGNMIYYKVYSPQSGITSIGEYSYVSDTFGLTKVESNIIEYVEETTNEEYSSYSYQISFDENGYPIQITNFDGNGVPTGTPMTISCEKIQVAVEFYDLLLAIYRYAGIHIFPID